MFLRPITTAYRQAGRYREVVNVLFRHGFGYLVDQVGLDHLISWRRRLFRRSPDGVVHLSASERARLVLEELGPTAIKLGQFLSARRDLIPPALARELEKLQDEVPPVDFEQVRPVVEAELGASLEELFATFDPKPLAAASLAQVHPATLPDGRPVVVKVQRPGIEERIEADLAILHDLAALLERRTELGKVYALTEVAEEFAHTIRAELDFRLEGHHADRFRENFAGDDRVHIPEVIWSHTARRVLTLERVYGVKITDVAGLRAAGHDPRAVAQRIAEAILTQIFDHGFFHADPHPGNIFISPEGRITFMDFGIVGYVDPKLREELAALAIALVRHDVDELVRRLVELSFVSRRIDIHRLRYEVARLLRRYYSVPIRDIRLRHSFEEFLSLVHRFHLRLPPDLTLLAKTLMTTEGILITLNPSVSVADIAEPFARRLMAEQASPERLLRQLVSTVSDLAVNAAALPRRLNTVLGQAATGELSVRIERAEAEVSTGALEPAANRLALALVAMAVTIGAVVLLQNGPGPRVFDVSILGLLTAAFAVFLTLTLLFAVLRTGKL
jgi:ubiquinone biosynthesis protein